MKTTVISLGGSLIVPDGIDQAFLRTLKTTIENYLRPGGRRVVIITGGGKVCRRYQDAAWKLVKAPTRERDWIGIASTKLNAELVRVLFGDKAHSTVLGDPTKRVKSSKKILVGAGWLPGHSTDMDAVKIAKVYSADRIINVTNIAKVYTKDPAKYRSARPVSDVTWSEYLTYIPRKWTSGMNTPFDPEASRKAKGLGLEVVIINGARCTQLRNVLSGRKFTGTLIHA